MALRRTRWKKVLPTVTLTVCSFSVTGQTAQAFFPPWWPNQTTPPAVIVSPPVAPPVTVVPPPPPPPFVVVPPTTPPPVVVVPPPVTPPVDPSCGCPQAVPEPSSLVAGLAGLTTAAGWAIRRRRK